MLFPNFKTWSKYKLVYIFLFVAFLFVGFFFHIEYADCKSPQKKELPANIVKAGVRADVMNFADRLMSAFSQITINLAKKAQSSDARLEVATVRVTTIAAAIDIAAQPNAGYALLDMLVFVTLNRIVWEEYRNPRQFNSQADVIVETFKKLERDIWSIAARVLTLEQQREMRELIQEWHEKHPNAYRVNFIRLSSFGPLGRKPALNKETKAGGLLGSVSQAVDAAEDIRETVERAMFKITRMQLVAGIQVDWAYQELAHKPEIQQALSEATKFNDSIQKLAKLLDSLPAKAEAKIIAATPKLIQQINTELKKILDDLYSKEENLKGLLGDINRILLDGTRLAEQAGQNLESLQVLAQKIDSMPVTRDLKSLDLNALHSLAVNSTVILEKVNSSLLLMNQLLSSSAWEQRLPELVSLVNRTEALGKSFMNHMFLLVAALIVIFFLALTIFRYISIKLSR